MKSAINISYAVLLISLWLTMASCRGQDSTNIPANKTTLSGQSKITLPKGVSAQTMFRCSMKDKDGNLWFGTTGAGIYKYDGKSFTRYSEQEGLSSNFVVGITQDIKGNIWAATDNGIFYKKGTGFSRLEIPEINGSTFGVDINDPSKKLQVFCVLGDKKGNVWFGTESEGLWKYDGIKLTNFKYIDGHWIEITHNHSDYKHEGFISAMVEDKKGNIWFSSSPGGLHYYDDTSFKAVNLNHSKHHTLQMIEDRSGNIWMATRLDGICRYNGNTIESFTEKDSVHDNMASCLYEAKNGYIWFGSLGKAGTAGGGLKGISVYNGKTFTHIPSTALRNDQVWTVIEDDSEHIWVGTREFGLFRYDGQSFTEFTKQ